MATTPASRVVEACRAGRGDAGHRTHPIATSGPARCRPARSPRLLRSAGCCCVGESPGRSASGVDVPANRPAVASLIGCADGRRGRLIEVQLDEGGLAAGARTACSVRVGDGRLRCRWWSAGRMLSVARRSSGSSMLERNCRKSTASGGASLPTAMPLAPPKASVGMPGAAGRRSGTGTSRARRRSPCSLVLLACWTRRRPLAHQFHGRLAVAHGRRLAHVVDGARETRPGTASWRRASGPLAGLLAASVFQLPLWTIWCSASAPPMRSTR